MSPAGSRQTPPRALGLKAVQGTVETEGGISHVTVTPRGGRRSRLSTHVHLWRAVLGRHPARTRGAPAGSRRRRAAFTLIELTLVVVIVGILTTLAVPNYQRVKERALIVRAIGDVNSLQQDVLDFRLANGRLPASLGEIGWGDLVDPWGNPYEFVPVTLGPGGKLLGFRKDRFLNPINSDFDLWSMGPDGRSNAQLTTMASLDDIIRANDGSFVGVAEDF